MNRDHIALFHAFGKFVLALNTVPLSMTLWMFVKIFDMNVLWCFIAGILAVSMIIYIIITRHRYEEIKERINQNKGK